jgi:malate dehydrogenase
MHVYGCKEDRLNQAAARMRKGHTLSAFHSDVHEGGVRLRAELKEGRFREAFSVMQEYLPDIRAILKPFVIRQSGAKTVMGTARATSKMLRAVTLGADALVSGQIALVGEWTASAAPSECHS